MAYDEPRWTFDHGRDQDCWLRSVSPRLPASADVCADFYFLSTNYIHWYHLRSYDRINAPYESFIKQMEEKSGISFDKARVALARKWIGKIDESLVQDKGLRNRSLLL